MNDTPWQSDTTTYTGPIRIVRVDPRDKPTVTPDDVTRLAKLGNVVVFASFPVIIEDDPNG